MAVKPRHDIAVVLGAGGARGLAHIGVLEVLRERGYNIVAIAGSSMGALIGGVFAAGQLDTYAQWARGLDKTGVFRLLDFGLGIPGLIRGDKLIGALRGLIGDLKMEELPIRYTAVATDLDAQREVWLDRGPLFDAIRASIAIPGIFTPQRWAGRNLMDGGLLAPIPIAATRFAMADRVVAVDVNARCPEGLVTPGDPEPDRDAEHAEPLVVPEDAASLRARISGFFEGWGSRTPTPPPVPAAPGMLDLMARSIDTMQAALSRLQLALDPPDLLIRVPRDACDFYEFWRADELIRLGREAAERALDGGTH
ncbi:patatin-like phospholipase family protein [Chiayiivirga flava]|uniref:NTE family protein n=1 Tax=Chiayiivirga flava TaxID=659595 RepID=A0A7W8D812_9GAMM|nr:patatin-like phospholipase family protein [Chiayiivirga flava]MBB5209608.1 NTE family protein [Chiayiivirga flava]